MAYAENTSVSVDRSKSEIEKVLANYGATGFMYGTSDNRSVIMFRANGRVVRFILPLPDPNDRQFAQTPTGRTRKADRIPAEYEQETRRRWRALALAIRAKLEAVQTGITEFEEEFLAHIVMPNGQTVAETAIPAIAEAYKIGKPVALIPGF